MVACGSICLPHVRQHDHRTAGSPGGICFSAKDGSTKVLATKGSGKTPAVYAGIALAVAFMGPKRRWPPVFYFSSMMAADTEKLATDSSLSTHPASVSACMALPQAREARPQTREARQPQTLVAQYNVAATTPVPAWSNSPLLIELNWSGELLNHALAWGGNWLRRAK